MLEAPHDIDGHAPGRNFNLRRTRAVKVMRFKRALAAIVAVIGMHPGIARSVGASVIACDGDPRGCFSATLSQYGEIEAPHRDQVLSSLRL